MDPLSISASIAGLSLLMHSILKAGYGHAKGLKSFPEEIRRLILEVTTLQGSLSALEIVAQRLETESSVGSSKRDFIFY
jgi:hypothetical protein